MKNICKKVSKKSFQVSKQSDVYIVENYPSRPSNELVTKGYDSILYGQIGYHKPENVCLNCKLDRFIWKNFSFLFH